jgi:hypothetical protein
MSGHARDPALSRRADLRRGRGSSDEAEQMCRGQSAEQCSVTAGEDSREVARLVALGSVPDPVDTSMLEDERSLPQPRLDLVMADARLEQR